MLPLNSGTGFFSRLPAFSRLLPIRAGWSVRGTLTSPYQRDLAGLGADVRITRRNLPHWSVSGSDVIYWITFRLADSIPQEALHLWKNARDKWARAHPPPWDSATGAEYDELFGDRFEAWLDQGLGSRALAKPEIRGIVRDRILHFDGERLIVHSAVIMPTHVHALLQPLRPHAITPLLKGIKGVSARQINQALGTSGAFWQEESYDHIVRNAGQLGHYFRYIEDNPRKAGLRPDEYWLYKNSAAQAFMSGRPAR